MKLKIAMTVALVGFSSGQLLAANQCPTNVNPTWLTGTAIKNLVSGKYACANRNANTKWNEKHLGAGFGPSDFEDYKLGPTNPIDPTKVMGQYTITDNGAAPGTIAYRYGTPPTFAGGTFTHQVRPQSSGIGNISYFWCNVDTGEILAVTINTSGPQC